MAGKRLPTRLSVGRSLVAQRMFDCVVPKLGKPESGPMSVPEASSHVRRAVKRASSFKKRKLDMKMRGS